MALSFALVSCTSDQRRTGDPLVGAHAAPIVPPAALGPPTPGSPTSNAALAGRSRPLEPGNELRIGPSNQNHQPTGAVLHAPASATPAAPAPPLPAQPSGSHSPVAVPPLVGPARGSSSPTPLPVAPVAPVPSSGGQLLPGSVPSVLGLTSYEQAQALLRNRGVKWQRLEMLSETEWKFTCSVPSRHNASLSRTYEARSTTFLGAMQAVLDQMDREMAVPSF